MSMLVSTIEDPPYDALVQLLICAVSGTQQVGYTSPSIADRMDPKQNQYRFKFIDMLCIQIFGRVTLSLPMNQPNFLVEDLLHIL